MRVVFVTNFCPHYRIRTFELLANRLNVEFLFFSGGQEWYWMRTHGVRIGAFPHEYLPGVTVGGTRITPTLVPRILRGNYSAVVKCINGRFALPATYSAARFGRLPFVLWTGVWQRLRTVPHTLMHPFTRYIYRNSDAIAVYGDHVRRFLVSSEGVAQHRVFTAPHATDPSSYSHPPGHKDIGDLRRHHSLREDSSVVLYVGRLEAAKGVRELLSAFLKLRHPHAQLVFVGSGSERHALEAEAGSADAADSVRFVAAVPPEEVVKYYSLADVLVLPSRTTRSFKEPWGLVVNEAYYQSLPVVVTESVGAAAGGLVVDGVTGLVVPEGDPDALGAALKLLIENPELRRELGARGSERVQLWSNDRMVDGFVRAVEYACSETRTR